MTEIGQWQALPNQTIPQVRPGDFVCPSCLSVCSRPPCVICECDPSVVPRGRPLPGIWVLRLSWSVWSHLQDARCSSRRASPDPHLPPVCRPCAAPPMLHLHHPSRNHLLPGPPRPTIAQPKTPLRPTEPRSILLNSPPWTRLRRNASVSRIAMPGSTLLLSPQTPVFSMVLGSPCLL